MHPFEQLLTGGPEVLEALFERFAGLQEPDHDRRLERIGQRLGLNVPQLVCAAGFNPELERLPRVLQRLGFSSHEALVRERNYFFINDVYQQLSIDNIVDIYRQLARHPDPYDVVGDLIASRLGHIESQIEVTINPVMIGSYKLEIRALYENGMASDELVATRLRPDYEVLRGIADEIILLARSGTVSAAELLARAGVSPEEKRRLLFHDLVTPDEVARHLAGSDVPARERQVLSEALARRS